MNLAAHRILRLLLSVGFYALLAWLVQCRCWGIYSVGLKCDISEREEAKKEPANPI